MRWILFLVLFGACANQEVQEVGDVSYSCVMNEDCPTDHPQCVFTSSDAEMGTCDFAHCPVMFLPSTDLHIEAKPVEEDRQLEVCEKTLVMNVSCPRDNEVIRIPISGNLYASKSVAEQPCNIHYNINLIPECSM